MKSKFQYSDFQKSERDFAFVLDKSFEVQELIKIISDVDKDLIKSIRVFDVYEGDNIDKDKKSVALNVTIQSTNKSLTVEDLHNLNKNWGLIFSLWFYFSFYLNKVALSK